MIDVALFPIPGAVSFPGVPRSLHVFEPRYRQMVRHCLSQDLPIGVCHTRKVIREQQPMQTREDVLNSNQSTYQPEPVLSAGPVELLQELEDGRLLIRVCPDRRLRLGREKQTLPFSIWACEDFPDQTLDASRHQALEQSKAKILQRLLALTHRHPEVQSLLSDEHWQAMPPIEFSFAVTGLIGMPPELAQALLEESDPQRRLDDVLAMINGTRH
jgi:Lon protease-like protein